MALALIAGGCRQDMHDQPVVEPFEASVLFHDGAGSRQLPEGTVARGLLRDDRELYFGLTSDDTVVTRLPLAVTRELLDRGRSRYDAFCSPCHGRTGDGLGMVVRRGFKQPSSFHDERLRQQPVGYFYTVISNGFGDMSSYAAQIRPEDRWAVVAYLRTLQWSRSTPLTALPPGIRSRLEAELSHSSASTDESHGAQ